MKPSPRFSTKNTSWCFNGWGACHPGLKHFRRAAIFGGESSKTCSIFGHSKLWGVFDSSKPLFLGYLLDMRSPRSGKTRSSFSWVFQFFGRRIVRGSPDSEALTVGFTSVLPSSSPLVDRNVFRPILASTRNCHINLETVLRIVTLFFQGTPNSSASRILGKSFWGLMPSPLDAIAADIIFWNDESTSS